MKKEGINIKNYLKQFRIAHAGLQLGIHEYFFSLEDPFFKHFIIHDISKPKIDVKIELEKQTTLLTLTFNITGNYTVSCDRCTSPLQMEIAETQTMYIKTAGKLPGDNTSEEIYSLDNNEGEVDVSHSIYEFISLSIPFKKVHPVGLCDKEMEKKIKEYETLIEKKESQDFDPRWEKLNELRNN
jgi:uncharacterized metal-binding protein YceD (DUF177 family)